MRRAGGENVVNADMVSSIPVVDYGMDIMGGTRLTQQDSDSGR